MDLARLDLGVAMRKLWLAAMMCGAALQGAHAADLPVLRGSLWEAPEPGPVNWEGFYIGGQGGYGSSDMNFARSTDDVAARMLANTVIENEMSVSQWPVLGKKSVHGQGYGGFVGYNAQWDDVVLGVEANYMHGTFGGSDSDSMSRFFTTSDGYTHALTYSAQSSIAIHDIGSIRARAGYAWNNFLPYMFGGVSLGQGDIIRTAAIVDQQTNAAAAPGFQNILYTKSQTDAQHGHFLFGYAAGLGVDIMLAQGLFFRAEWEYLKFAAPIDTGINTVRAGLGYKF